MSQTNRKNFYDLEQIKQIPILDVCNAFGIAVEPKGGKIWCKLRPERTASVILHPENNSFYDFGDHSHGDAIELVSAYLNVDRGRAIGLIGESFSISPENPRAGFTSTELTPMEYQKIGLDGQRANRNFTYDIERQGMDKVMELDLRYAMPMNVLKKTNPRIFEKLIKQKSIPLIRDLRNEYYMEVFSQYNLAKAVGSEEVFQRAAERGEFRDQIKELQAAERALYRACQGTQIKAWPVGEYDPVNDLEKILSGEVKLTLGTASYFEMKTKSEKEKSPVKYLTVSLDGFLKKSGSLSDYAHSAFIKDGKVVVGYLEKDAGSIRPLLNKMRDPSKGNLNQKIASAEKQQKEQVEQSSFDLGPKESRKGEER